MILPSDAGSEARSSILKRLLKERVWEASPEVLRAGISLSAGRGALLWHFGVADRN